VKKPFFSVGKKRKTGDEKISLTKQRCLAKRRGRARRKGTGSLRENKVEQPGNKQNGKKQTIPVERGLAEGSAKVVKKRKSIASIVMHQSTLHKPFLNT